MTPSTPPKVAPITGVTGVTGQDGAYLSELLLNKGYEVHGIERRASLLNTDRIDHLYQHPHVRLFDGRQRFKLHYGDLTDSTNLIRIIQLVQPDEIYNLDALNYAAASFETPEYTAPWQPATRATSTTCLSHSSMGSSPQISATL